MISSTQGHAVTASGDGGTVLERAPGTQRTAGLSLQFPAALLYSAVYSAADTAAAPCPG